MAYCRWSSDDWQCDVYVYEHCDGHWQIEIAAMRHEFDRSALPPPVDPREDVDAWLERERLTHSLMAKGTFEAVDHPEAGGWLSPATAGECADELDRLKREGLRVPQGVIDLLREEQAEADR